MNLRHDIYDLLYDYDLDPKRQSDLYDKLVELLERHGVSLDKLHE